MVFETICDAINQRTKNNPKNIVGIIGLPGSGKSTLALELQNYFLKNNVAAVPWEGDIYSTSSRQNRSAVMSEINSKRLNGGNYDNSWPGRAYHYNLPLLAQHLDFFKVGKNFSANGLCHPKRKSLDLSIEMQFSENNIDVNFDGEKINYRGEKSLFLVDWALLTISSIRPKLDFTIYVNADFDVRAERVKKRLSELPEPKKLDEDFFRDVEEYQKIAFSVYPEFADLVLDNNNFSNRRITSSK